MATISRQVLRRIRRQGRGSVFTPKDFIDLGSRAVIDQTLSRLTQRNVIRRLKRGLYDYPRISPRLGVLSPNLDHVAQALAKQTGSRLQISGARAANTLGLTTQVPAKAAYLTDGPSRTAKIGTQTVQLRHASPKTLVGAGKVSGAILQALRYLGRDAVDQGVIGHLKTTLPAVDKQALKRDCTHVPDWVRPVVDQIAQAV